MSHNTAPHIDIVRLEDKETKLKSFIKAFIEGRAADADAAATGARNLVSAGGDGDGVLLLVLRSLDSPLAKAVAALVQERVLDMPIRAIIAVIDRGELQGEASLFTLDNAVRMARDPRLLDVHEQLVLGPSTSWVGDCMRRDPRKRDAYECYAADCQSTAQWARISFERLWKKSEAIGHASNAALTSAATEASAALASEATATRRGTSVG